MNASASSSGYSLPPHDHKRQRRQLCDLPGCNRPTYEAAGVVHAYCGRTHAAEKLGSGSIQPPHGCCHVCKLPGCDEEFFEAETGRVHDFCCRTHADEAIACGQWSPSLRGQQGAPAAHRRSLPGCSAPRYLDQKSGQLYDFCGRSHALVAKQRGLVGVTAGPPIAADQPETVERVFGGQGGPEGYTVALMTRQHPKYDGIKDQFLDRWAHPGPKPRIRRLLQVRNAESVYRRFKEYQEEQGRLGNPSDDLRRFHGTSLTPNCNFGLADASGPCTGVDCAVCGICRHGFGLHRQLPNGVRRLPLRYGVGHYFSKTSSKSNQYADNSERILHNKKMRLMFLCRVVPGRSFVTNEEDMSENDLQKQVHGAGYTSVEARNQARGGPLNHDELVIYHDAAAIPSYLIVYELP